MVEGGSARTADLTQVRSVPPTCKRMPRCKDIKHGGRIRRYADLPSRVLNYYTSGRAPTSYRGITGELAHTGLNQRVLAQQTRRPNASTRQAPDSPVTYDM
ncbi:hypothetical protein B296_00044043, partial [Ensete ventricosum]